jgi:hypothetical protein
VHLQSDRQHASATRSAKRLRFWIKDNDCTEAQDEGRIVGCEAISDLASAEKELFDYALYTGATSVTSWFHVIYI